MWNGILGHDEIVERFRRTLAAGRLASTYLFVGPPGVGKKLFARELARVLFCPHAADEELEACGECESCRLFAAGNHPDLLFVGLESARRLGPKYANASMLPVAAFVGEPDERNQVGLCHEISLRPYLGNRRVAIIDDADLLTNESANCLLKTLEEPPPNSLLILIGTSPARQLPTIRSRAQVIRFQLLSTENVAEILLDTGVVAESGEAARLAVFGEGSVERAARMADPAICEFRERLLKMLASPSLGGVPLARAVQSFVDEAGKEAALRRERLRTVVDFAIDFYGARLRHESRPIAMADDPISPPPRGADGPLDFEQTERLVRALGACLEALQQVDRNANLGLVIENWCEQLAGRSKVQA
jgi:DNA polymerase-3 subunit delta'